MLPIIADTFRVALTHTDGNGSNIANVIHIEDSARDAHGVAALVESHMLAAMWGLLWSGYGGAAVEVTKLDGTSATVKVDHSGETVWEGQASGDPIPEMAFGLTLYTDLRGRRNRGRLFIGPITEPQQFRGSINPTSVAASTAAWTTFSNALVTDSAAMVVASYRGATKHQVTNILGHIEARTQVRRLRAIR